jgi:hypothetical protein
METASRHLSPRVRGGEGEPEGYRALRKMRGLAHPNNNLWTAHQVPFTLGNHVYAASSSTITDFRMGAGKHSCSRPFIARSGTPHCTTHTRAWTIGNDHHLDTARFGSLWRMRPDSEHPNSSTRLIFIAAIGAARPLAP